MASANSVPRAGPTTPAILPTKPPSESSLWCYRGSRITPLATTVRVRVHWSRVAATTPSSVQPAGTALDQCGQARQRPLPTAAHTTPSAAYPDVPTRPTSKRRLAAVTVRLQIVPGPLDGLRVAAALRVQVSGRAPPAGRGGGREPGRHWHARLSGPGPCRRLSD